MNEQFSLSDTDVKKQLERLLSTEVDVPDAWRTGTNPDVHYPGDCYCRACRYVIDLAKRLPKEQIWLVHGEYGFSIGHAWVELPGDVVFDAVLQRFYGKQGYYEIQSANPLYMYSSGAAMRLAANIPGETPGTTRFGEWHLVLKLPPADPQAPTVIDFDHARELLITSGLRPDMGEHSKNNQSAMKRMRRGRT